LDDDGSVLDDIIVWWVSATRFDVMPNASNTDRVVNALGVGRDVTAERAVLAVQGPDALAKVATFAPDLAELKRNDVRAITIDGVDVVVAGTGYTGERGCEFAVPAAAADALWQRIVDAAAEPAGLGARDTLRLEAGLPLHGHELGPGITPLQAGLGWVIGWDKGDFRGRAALEAERDRGVTRKLRGIATEGRRPPRADQQVTVDGEAVGTVTSGNFSPMLGHGIALAFLPPDVADGTPVVVEGRDALKGAVVPLPFWRR
jgi:aminomethyltransferase